jgi:hypothetical protein
MLCLQLVFVVSNAFNTVLQARVDPSLIGAGAAMAKRGKRVARMVKVFMVNRGVVWSESTSRYSGVEADVDLNQVHCG